MSEPIANPVITPEPTPAKTFTQEEVDAIVGKRLAKAMKGVPTEEEMTAFRAWKDGQQSEQERWNTLTQEKNTAQGRVTALEMELEQMKRERYIFAKGVTGEEAEFIAFKAAKMVDEKTTFEAAVDQLVAGRENKPAFDWTAPLEKRNDNAINQSMNALIRQARR